MLDGVVITRPLAQAGPLAARLAGLGRPVEVLPLLEIAPLDVAAQATLHAALAGLASYALVAFVSPNAVDAALSLLPGWPPGVALAVLGEGSRAALARHGVTPANATILSPPEDGPSDSEHLLPVLKLAQLRGQRVLVVRGDRGRELMVDGLRAAGALVEVVAAYQRRVPPLTPALAARLRHLLGQRYHWLVTSSEALRGLLALLSALDADTGAASDWPAAAAPADISRSAIVVNMQHQHLIVPHARIAQTAQALGFQRITLAGSGDERLLAALQLLT